MFIKEITISIILILLGVLFLDPFMLWMPAPLLYAVSAVFIILFAVFLVFVWRERARDEREQLHAMMSARIGYLMGIAAIAGMVLVQVFVYHHADPWFVVALFIMVLGKIAGMLYSKARY